MRRPQSIIIGRTFFQSPNNNNVIKVEFLRQILHSHVGAYSVGGGAMGALPHQIFPEQNQRGNGQRKGGGDKWRKPFFCPTPQNPWFSPTQKVIYSLILVGISHIQLRIGWDISYTA